RTPAGFAEQLRKRLAGYESLVWTGPRDGANPYPGLLAHADRIVCTGDSVNMLSEACATAVPVHVAGIERIRGRPRRYIESLLGSGRARPLGERMDGYAVTPLRETAWVAAEVERRPRRRAPPGPPCSPRHPAPRPGSCGPASSPAHGAAGSHAPRAGPARAQAAAGRHRHRPPA